MYVEKLKTLILYYKCNNAIGYVMCNKSITLILFIISSCIINNMYGDNITPQYPIKITGDIVFDRSYTNKVIKSHYIVWRGENKWRIRLIPITKNKISEPFAYHELGTDGTNIYHISVFNREYDKRIGLSNRIEIFEKLMIKHRGEKKYSNDYQKMEKELIRMKEQYNNSAEKMKSTSVNNATGLVMPRKYPEYSIGKTSSMLWLIYCSDEYLNTVSDKRIPQVYVYRHPLQYNTNNYVKCIVSRNKTTPKLPETIHIINDGYIYDPYNTSELIKIPMKKPFLNGYTNGVYTTGAFTNIGIMAFPLSFKMAIYIEKKMLKV